MLNNYKINIPNEFYSYVTTICENEINNAISKKIDSRISKLKKLGYEYEFNEKDMIISEKCLRKFIDMVHFYEYPKGIGLGEAGYFGLDIKNQNYFMSILFRNKMHLYIHNFKDLIITNIIKPEEFFDNVDIGIYSNFFNKKNSFVESDNYYISELFLEKITSVRVIGESCFIKNEPEKILLKNYSWDYFKNRIYEFRN